jgi:CheY-like chemotaxis protein
MFQYKFVQCILCVDDEQMVLMSLKYQLKEKLKERAIIETANDAEQALETIEELHKGGVKVVIVISDYHMPGLKGDEFLTIVKEKYREVKCIMITSHIEDSKIKQLLDKEIICNVFSKPWDENLLIQTINGLLDEYNNSNDKYGYSF